MNYRENLRGTPIVIVLSMLLAFLLVWANSFDSDMQFWQSWANQLISGGFGQLNANYPPVYLEWFWVVAQIFKGFSLIPANDPIFKLWSLLPVLFAQFILLILLARVLAQKGKIVLRSPVFWLTAFNPAILMDGPVWGQVDIVPMVPIILALYLYEKDSKYAFWLPTLGIFAVLIKFQAIVFLPLLGALALKHPKRMALGLLPAIGLSGLILLPFYATDTLVPALKRAYTDNLNIYPFTTYNAANFWYLLGQNLEPDNVIAFSWKPAAEGWQQYLTPKKLGMIAFAITSLWIFISTLIRKHTDIWKSALILISVFFLFASGMHERYFFPIVIIAAFAAAFDEKRWRIYLLASILVWVNIVLILPLKGDQVWTITAWLTLALFPLILFDRSKLEGKIHAPLRKCFDFSTQYRVWIYSALSLGLILYPLKESYAIWKNNQEMQKAGKLYLSAIIPEYTQQEWGSLRQNKSVEGKELRVGGKAWKNGLGTHARSTVRYKIPPGATSFNTIVGLDQEVRGGKVRFLVLVDGRHAWKSPVMYAHSNPAVANIPLKSSDKELTLIVDPQGSNREDHADWINPHFSFKKVESKAKINANSPKKSQAVISPDRIIESGVISIPLVQMTPSSHTQGWGKLQINKTVDSNPLKIGGKVYPYGFGTHAPSKTTFTIPQGAYQFYTQFGLDDESPQGEIGFKIYFDNQIAWTSKPVNNQSGLQSILLDIPQGTQTIRLETDDLGNSFSDHADWIAPIFKKK